jgi:hypothetical protein
MSKKKYFEQMDEFSRFFQHHNYWAYQSSTEPESYMLMNTGSTAPIVIMLNPQRVTIHRGDDQHFYSCRRKEWGPDFLEQCGKKEGKYRSDYCKIARDYRSYRTLDDLGRFLVDECGMRIESEKHLKPKICHLEQTVYDATAYYTLTIDFREDRNHFDLMFEIAPFEENFPHEKKYSNMTDWSAETLERIGKELPIKILTDYMKKYRKKFVQAQMKAENTPTTLEIEGII